MLSSALLVKSKHESARCLSQEAFLAAQCVLAVVAKGAKPRPKWGQAQQEPAEALQVVRGSSYVSIVSRYAVEDQKVGTAHLSSVCSCLCVCTQGCRAEGRMGSCPISNQELLGNFAGAFPGVSQCDHACQCPMSPSQLHQDCSPGSPVPKMCFFLLTVTSRIRAVIVPPCLLW